MRHVLRTFFQNARKPGGLSGRIMLWAMNWGHASLAKWGRSHVSLEPDARVLDIGCGGGANLAQFLKLCPQGSVCGIDFSAESVATSLRKNAGAVAAGHCEVRRGMFPGCPMPMRPSISSPLSRRSTSGRMYPPPLPRCSAYSDRPACF